MSESKKRIEARRLERIKREHQENLNNNNAPFKLPKLFADATLEDFNLPQYPKNMANWSKKKAKNKESLFVGGEFGAGKSRWAYAYAKYLYLELGIRQVVVIRFSDIFKHVGVHYGEFKEDEVFKQLKKCSHLIIDDIRKIGGKNEKQYDAFVDLLDARIEGGLTTCFTSNVAPENISTENNRITSRLTRILKKKENVKVFKKSFVKEL